MATEKRAYILREGPDGPEGKMNLSDRPTLADAQKIIGGYIQFAPGKTELGHRVTLVVDEDGLAKGLLYNSRASALYSRACGRPMDIVGTAIVLEGWRTVGPNKKAK